MQEYEYSSSLRTDYFGAFSSDALGGGSHCGSPGSVIHLCFMLYLDLFRKDYYERKGSLSLLFTLIMFYCVVTALMVANNIYNVYIIPYAMLPVIIRVFLDSRTAFLTQVVTIQLYYTC